MEGCLTSSQNVSLSVPLAVARRGYEPWSRAFGGQKGPRTKEKQIEKFFFCFKQKKETRKGINASQLAIRNFNDITGKHINTLCIFNFYVVFLKSQSISSTSLQKSSTSSFFWKTYLFPVQSSI